MFHSPCFADECKRQIFCQSLVSVLVCLSTSIASDASGFHPLDRQHGLALFGDLRWKGWADALHDGRAEHAVVIGGYERIPEGDLPAGAGYRIDEDGRALVPRPQAACLGLMERHGVEAQKLSYHVSEGNTGGNIAALRALMEQLHPAARITVTTSHYHIPRMIMDLQTADLSRLSVIPSEAYTVARLLGEGIARETIHRELATGLGGGPLADRCAAEIMGAADKLAGTYRPLSR